MTRKAALLITPTLEITLNEDKSAVRFLSITKIKTFADPARVGVIEFATPAAKLGFYKKAKADDEVPEEFRFSPAKDSPFKDEPQSQTSTSPPTEKTSVPDSKAKQDL